MPSHVLLIVVVVVGVLVMSNRGAAAAAAFFPSIKLPSFEIGSPPSGGGGTVARQLEDRLLEAIESNDVGRLSNSDEIESLVTQLESTPGGGTPRPAVSPLVMGRWRLMHTSNADSASPIQRRAVDASKYRIYQDIFCRSPRSDDDGESMKESSSPTLVVSQVVEFGDDARLRVDALASTSAYPIAELTERVGTGRILGLNILGVSLVGEEAGPDPERPDSRIDFVFDEGNFVFGKFKVPYPVPFRWPIFRDAVKGWIDITYLSDRIRISRGNKGTTFVLLKEGEIE